jgi:hypothetical protein
VNRNGVSLFLAEAKRQLGEIQVTRYESRDLNGLDASHSGYLAPIRQPGPDSGLMLINGASKPPGASAFSISNDRSSQKRCESGRLTRARREVE